MVQKGAKRSFLGMLDCRIAKGAPRTPPHPRYRKLELRLAYRLAFPIYSYIVYIHILYKVKTHPEALAELPLHVCSKRELEEKNILSSIPTLGHTPSMEDYACSEGWNE